MKYELIKKDWYKRRVPSKQAPATVINVEVPDYEKKHNHMCSMVVEYDNGHIESLVARVIQNQITKEWTVDGMKVAIRIL